MGASVAVESSSAPQFRNVHVMAWVAQLLLALAFGTCGLMKVLLPLDVLARDMGWVSALPGLVRFIGASELACAVGLVVPSAVRIVPVLTVLAAMGLAGIMVLAAGLHLSRGELAVLPVNVLLGGVAAFVAYARLVKAPIAQRHSELWD